jgi:hypothetical protein
MKPIILALAAGRKRQSPVTGFIHHCYESPERSWETIPIYENFCFALALFRSRTAENMLEAKALLEKLFSFEVNGEFPVYLHEYPQCRHAGLMAKLYPVVRRMLDEFSLVLGEKNKTALHNLRCEPSSIRPSQTPQAWAEFLVNAQLTGEDVTPALHWWSCRHLAFTGAQQQERGEPAVTLYDLFLGEWGGRYAARALQDHPVHLQASLIYPQTVVMPECQSKNLFLWGDGNPTHSAVLTTQGVRVDDGITLLEKEVQDEVEIAFYCNCHLDHQIAVNGTKATSFQLGDCVTIQSKAATLTLVFTLEQGEGLFWGHIYRGNRPGQLSCYGEHRHETYDWVIALRTVQRKAHCQVRAFSIILES